MFPARSEADWRKAAEAALKGAALDRLVSVTADGLALGPLHPGRVGPRALRAESGPWKALARLDHPSPDDLAAQAAEELTPAPTAFRSCSPGLPAPMATV